MGWIRLNCFRMIQLWALVNTRMNFNLMVFRDVAPHSFAATKLHVKEELIRTLNIYRSDNLKNHGVETSVP
jgi:hypothetical protein